MRRAEREVLLNAQVVITVVASFALGVLAMLLITGCDEGLQMAGPIMMEPAETEPTIPAEPTTPVDPKKETPMDTDPVPPTVVMGEMKSEGDDDVNAVDATTDPSEPEVVVPEKPRDITPPTVVEVSWYHNQQMTKPVMDDVRPGDTIYTVVTFSEAMQHTVADDDSARPALSVVIDGMTTRYRMLPHGVSFKAGEAKPLGDGTDGYLCKYTVPEGTSGTVALRIGSETADTAGNTVLDAEEYIAPFIVAEPEVRQEEPTIPESVAPTPVQTDNLHLQRAIEVVDKIDKRQREESYGKEDGTILDTIFFEETGISYFDVKFLYGKLTGICERENPEKYSGYISKYWLAVEYLRLYFTHPEDTKYALLEKFKESARQGVMDTTNPHSNN